MGAEYRTIGNLIGALQSQGFAPAGSSFDFFILPRLTVPSAQYFLIQFIMSNKNNRPRYTVCVARDTEYGKSYFTRIGSAFEMKESDGLSIVLEAHPIGDRILLFPEKEKPAPKAEQAAKPSPESPPEG